MNSEAPRLTAFLASIREFPHIGHAAKAAGISRSTHYARYDRDEVYRAKFEEAWRWGVGVLRDEAIRRAHSGYQEPVIYKGKYQYVGKGKNKKLVTITKYPERLLMKVLSAEIPNTYNTSRVEHTGAGGGPIKSCIEVRFVKPKP